MAGYLWSEPANWKDNATGQRSNHAAGIANAAEPNPEDNVTFDATHLGNCGQSAFGVSIKSLTMAAAYTGIVYVNEKIVVDGGGGTLAGGTMYVGDWEGLTGDGSGGNLDFKGGNVSWTGTNFTAQFFTPNLPGRLWVHSGATMTVTGPDRSMAARLEISDPSEAVVSTVTMSNMTGSLAFQSRTEVRVYAKGELHLNNNNAQGASGSISALDISYPVKNYGLIERDGTGTVMVGFPIQNLALTSILQVDAGTLSVNVPPVGVAAVSQSFGTTEVKSGATLQVPTGGFKMTGGVFQTKGGGIATVMGKFEMQAGALKIAYDQTNANGAAGILAVYGQVNLYGGDVHMKAYNTPQTANCDEIYSSVGVDIKTAASLHVVSYGPPPPEFTYDVIEATSAQAGGTGITGDFGVYDIGTLNHQIERLGPIDRLRLTP